MPTIIYDRKNKMKCVEKEYKSRLLNIAYTNKIGNIILENIIIKPWFSKLVRLYYNSRLSKIKVNQFIEDYNINVDRFIKEDFKTFNDFFKRRKIFLRELPDNNYIISPCDARVLLVKIDKNTKLNIKNIEYTLSDILNNEDYAMEFSDGYALLFRLAVDDCHRYNYIDSGETLDNYKIPGVLHTVRHYSNKYQIYKRNKREVSILNTNKLGKIAMIEIGAVLIGNIVNENKKSFRKNEEKGHFEYGGSSILVLLKDIKNIRFDEDILEMSRNNIETKISMGETIGKLI